MHNQDAASPEAGGERLVAGRYRLLSVLGEGGMGTVWRAHDEVLHREVAVKEVRVSLDLPAERSKRMHVRLEREAWAAARVNARAVVTVHDVVTFDDRPWIVMELVRGRSLADVIGAEGALPPAEVARIGTEVLAALRAAHAAGVLHRDVKPANVLLADEGRVVLTDFGIATVEGDTALTMTGEVVGSPEYLAPERALGRTPGAASDLWSLGALLYAAVQGRSPFRRTTALATLRAIVDDEPPPAHRAGPLAPVIEGLLLKDPEERMTADEAGRLLRLAAGDAAAPSETETSTDATAATPPAAATATSVATTSATGGITAAVTAAVTTAEEVPTATVASMETAPTAVDADATAPVSPAAPAPLGTFGPPASGAGFGPVITEPGPAFGAFGHDTGPAPAPARRSRRTAYLIGAAAAVLVLLGGGLAYALVTQDDDKDKNGGAGTGGSASQPVSVTVTGNATTYDGSCPPGDGQAPWFTATFTTDRAPVQFSYRWVSENGSVVDRQWRTLSFREGDPTSKKETVRLSTYAQAGTLRSAMAVEIKSPFDAKSNTVAFSITCRPGGE
ncbi:serine/threonine protein kinase [Streptomyces sp. Ru62]|uniref:serine/threonine-protein kinase n=1 Tax=Streptomyces sp. Ru62 TaxID=2080745 RepID=UPI000CDCEBAE|nr:serine/threonine-protein kinase [Streptomyces sp. Ru62]POX62958.1 serine/threonine protein kinase [Streptomyces sp. Ru62]